MHAMRRRIHTLVCSIVLQQLVHANIPDFDRMILYIYTHIYIHIIQRERGRERERERERYIFIYTDEHAATQSPSG